MGPLYHSSDRPVRGHVINMFSKIVKPNGEQPDELEKSIGEALLELEVNSDLKNQLRELYITSAKELEIGDKKKCIIIFVPYLCSEVSTKSKYDWSVNWRRNFLVNMYSLLLRGEFFPNPQEKHETRSKCDQEVELSHQSTIPSLKTSCFHRRS